MSYNRNNYNKDNLNRDNERIYHQTNDLNRIPSTRRDTENRDRLYHRNADNRDRSYNRVDINRDRMYHREGISDRRYVHREYLNRPRNAPNTQRLSFQHAREQNYSIYARRPAFQDENAVRITGREYERGNSRFIRRGKRSNLPTKEQMDDELARYMRGEKVE
ncbi:hypothetical protein COBT_001275 [Conglomerata obtusa]